MTEKAFSEHEVRVYEAVRLDGGWLTSREVAAKADVAPRTARGHTGALAGTGVFEVVKVFGGYRYRIKSDPSVDARKYIADLEEAKEVLSRL